MRNESFKNTTENENMEDSINAILLLSSVVDRLFSELVKHESVRDMDPELLEMVHHAAEVASEYYVDINLLGGDEDE